MFHKKITLSKNAIIFGVNNKYSRYMIFGSGDLNYKDDKESITFEDR
jgi:hypothetical protein